MNELDAGEGSSKGVFSWRGVYGVSKGVLGLGFLYHMGLWGIEGQVSEKKAQWPEPNNVQVNG